MEKELFQTTTKWLDIELCSLYTLQIPFYVQYNKSPNPYSNYN